jgi:hypothetical protein
MMKTDDDTKNASREQDKGPKEVSFSGRLASLSDSQLKALAKVINDAVKDRAGKASLIGSLSDEEFAKLRDDLVDKADKEKSKKGGK